MSCQLHSSPHSLSLLETFLEKKKMSKKWKKCPFSVFFTFSNRTKNPRRPKQMVQIMSLKHFFCLFRFSIHPKKAVTWKGENFIWFFLLLLLSFTWKRFSRKMHLCRPSKCHFRSNYYFKVQKHKEMKPEPILIIRGSVNKRQN